MTRSPQKLRNVPVLAKAPAAKGNEDAEDVPTVFALRP